MKITTNGPQSVGQVDRYFRSGHLFLSPEEYQRESAWGLEQKQLLVDTIFRSLDIPKFYFWKIDQRTLMTSYPDGPTKAVYAAILEKQRKENEVHDPYVFEVVDGQQRIRTILEFMAVKPPNQEVYRGVWLEPYRSLEDTPVAKGRFYSALNPEQQIRFEQTSLSVMVLEDATIAEIRDMFLRLQNGTPLNAQQKRDAMGSEVGSNARILSELKFFTTSVPFSNDLGDHRRVASQMLLLEYRDRISPCTSQRLDRFYEEHKHSRLDAGLFGRVKRIVEVLGRIFPEKNHHLNRSYSLSIYWALSRLLQTYSIADGELSKIRENFENLNVARLEAQQRDFEHRPNDEILQDLSFSMSRGTDGAEQIESRHEILMQYLFERVALTSLPQLDPQRGFSYEEKLILFHRADGKCQLTHNGNVCNRTIPFEEAAIDHIVPYSKGGRTELSNGRYAAQPCNIARGTRDDFDPAKQCLVARRETEL